MAPTHAALDQRHRLGAASGAAGRVRAGNGVDAQIAQLLIEETVVGAAAELAIGDETQAKPLLQGNRVGDRRVFRRGQIGP